jgi:hypothetical protein
MAAAETLNQTIEVEPQLEVLLDDVLDGNRWVQQDTARVGVLRQQRLRVTFDSRFGEIWHPDRHLSLSSFALAPETHIRDHSIAVTCPSSSVRRAPVVPCRWR